jgi:hypothetical protein
MIERLQRASLGAVLASSALAAAFTMCPSVAQACSCMDTNDDGFITSSKPSTPATRELDKGHVALPKNAKGVLFYLTPGLASSAGTPTVEQFSARDETSGAEVPLSLRELNVPTARPGRYDVISAPDPMCLGPQVEADENQRHFCKENYVPAKAARLYRVEPVAGFVAGHKYHFATMYPKSGSVGRTFLRVSVDEKDLPLTALAAMTLGKVQAASTSKMHMGTINGSCSMSASAITQKVAYDLPPQAAEYKHLFRHVTLMAPRGRPYRLWSYKASLCSPDTFGRNDSELGAENVFIPCDGNTYSDLMAGADYTVQGESGVLEVQDEFTKSNELEVRLDRHAPGQCGTPGNAAPDVADGGATSSSPSEAGVTSVPARTPDGARRACQCSAIGGSAGGQEGSGTSAVLGIVLALSAFVRRRARGA